MISETVYWEVQTTIQKGPPPMPTLYPSTTLQSTTWPEPIESLYQALPMSGQVSPRYRRRDIKLADRLFIAGMMHIPRTLRPHSMVSWAAESFRTSRQTLYDIRDRVGGALAASDEQVNDAPAPALPVEQRPITDADQMARMILKLLFPGGMAYRPLQECLMEARGCGRSIGYISELTQEAGLRAGKILSTVQWPAKPTELVLSRDEAYFSNWPMLLTVEPDSLAIVSGDVTESANGEVWGISLALTLLCYDARRLQISEDGASFYRKSIREALALLKEADLDCEVFVQNDVWHLSDAATKVQSVLDSAAEKALAKMFRHERPNTSAGIQSLKAPRAWLKAEAIATPLVEQADETRFLIDCLHDSLELVDLRSGEIRDYEINHWLLTQTIQALTKIDHPRVQTLVTTLMDQEPHLLTFLRDLDEKLLPWRNAARAHFEEPELVLLFERAVARAWRLDRALVNGHTRLRATAARATANLDALVGRDPLSRELADRLYALLDLVVRTSCASENVNSVLKPLIWAHRHFPSRQSAQSWLNLFILWFNMHVFQRGKRKGHSPFELAGVKVFTPDGRETDDWLEALGYPAAA